MDKNNLELFKQAVSEGLSQKLDSVVDSCTEEIVCSKRHELAMRTIVRGKVDTKRTLSPKMRRIIAILVAAALILTSCGIIFRNEILEIFEDFFVKLTYSNNEDGEVIEDVYELGYLPDGYFLDDKAVSHTIAKFNYTNRQGDLIKFEQRILDGSDFTIDSESGYSKVVEMQEYNMYYRYTGKYHNYIWSSSKYTFQIKSNQKLQNEEIALILDGLKTK